MPTVRRRFDVSLTYQNGTTNYVRAESLAKRKLAESRLAQLGFNGQLIHQHPIDDQPGQLVVLSSDPAEEADIEEAFRRILKEFHVRFVPYQEAGAFAHEVEKAAH